MDHYPYPPGSTYPPIQVPHLPFKYLAGRDGDCSVDFSSFPSRNGWDKNEFLTGQLSLGKTPEDAAAFLQAWLFFGLASSVLGLPPQPENMFLVRFEGGGQSLISTKALPQMLQTWTERVLDFDSTRAELAIKTASMCLDEASVFSRAASSKLEGFRLEKHYPEIRLSIMALGDQLQSAMRQLELKMNKSRHKIAGKAREIFGAHTFLGKAASKMERLQSVKTGILKAGWRDPFSTKVEDAKFQDGDIYDDLFWQAEDRQKASFMGPWHWGTSSYLRERMIQAGWCAYEMARLQDVLSPWAAIYACSMNRKIIFDHSTCTELHCHAHTIDESTYSTQHVESGCTCEFVEMPQDEAKKIFDKGGFPIFKVISQPGSTSASLQLLDRQDLKYWTDEDQYSISHVWSHGLGNASANALPTCQLLRLMEIVGRDEFHPERCVRWLWLDTLCVPLEPKYRKLAISKLSEVYWANFGTLVLDKELLRTSCKGLSSEEVLLRVFCSTWMQRLWTLQEGASDHVTVVFADGQMDLKAAMRRFQLANPLYPIAKGGDAMNMMMQMILAREVPVEFLKLFGERASEDFNVMRIWNGMRWRQATKPGDESIIAAALLFAEKFSTMADYKADPESFNKIIQTPAEHRWTTLFNARKSWPQGILFVNCQTLPEKGMRWAPCEVGTYGREITDSTPSRVTPHGLVVKRPGFMFLAIRTKLDHTFQFLDVATSDWYEVTLMEGRKPLQWPEPGDSSFAVVQSKRLAGYAKVPAVMGRVEEIRDGVIHMEFACKVYVANLFRDKKKELSAMLESDPNLTFGPKFTRAARYEEGQNWCIG